MSYGVFYWNLYMNKLNKILINKEIITYMWLQKYINCLNCFNLDLKQIKVFIKPDHRSNLHKIF